MHRITFIATAMLMFSGCASTGALTSSSVDSDSAVAANSQAQPASAVYLAELRAKKNRFLESQGYEADYEPLASEAIKLPQGDFATLAVSECGKIAHSQWAASVLYGQNFTGYENYLRTMERCFDHTAQG